MNITLVVSKLLGLRVLKSINESLNIKITVVTCDDRNDKDRTVFEELNEYSKVNNLDVLVLSGAALNQYLIENKPDLCLVCGWYWLIDLDSINSCRLGCLGIHNSLLPKFRGGAPLVWSIISGDSKVGSSLFLMSEGMDDGPLVHQWKLEITSEQYMTEILETLEGEIVSSIGSIIDNYINEKITTYRQKNDGLSYTSQRKKDDSLIDWNKSGVDLFNECRALQNPYPNLHFIYKNEEYQIKRVKVTNIKCFARRGKVLAYINDGMLVSLGINKNGVLITLLTKNGDEFNIIPQKPFFIGASL